MDEHTWILAKGAALILLPLIPAYILFRAFPESTAAGNGKFAGFSWKFGGAFSGYAFLALVLFYFFVKSEPEPEDPSQLWEISGLVKLDPPPAVSRVIELKTIPERFQVYSAGQFKLAMIVRKEGDQPEFPALVVDGNAEGYPPQTFILNQADTLFPGLEIPKLEVVKGAKNKARVVNPLVVKKAAP